MTDGQNFKKGDRVRYIGDDDDFGYDLPLVGGAVYVVDKAYDSEVDLETPYIFMGVDVNDLELVEPTDRRTDFLRKLGALLREYDASFEFYDVYDMEIRIGEESVEYSFLNKENSPTLTADNIMDFDKS